MGAGDSKDSLKHSESGIPVLDIRTKRSLHTSFKTLFSPYDEFESQDKVFNYACAEFKKYSGGKKKMTEAQFKDSMAPLIKRMRESLAALMEKNKGNKWFSLEAMGFGDDLPLRIFRIFDTDNNGTIDIGEYLIYFVFFRVEPFGRAVSFFVGMDRDGDGHLTPAEVQKLFEVNVFATLVSDQISEEQHSLIEQHAKEYIQEVDKNSNGSVELIEFLENFKLFMKHVNVVLTSIRDGVNKKKNLSGEDFDSLPDVDDDYSDDDSEEEDDDDAGIEI